MLKDGIISSVQGEPYAISIGESREVYTLFVKFTVDIKTNETQHYCFVFKYDSQENKEVQVMRGNAKECTKYIDDIIQENGGKYFKDK